MNLAELWKKISMTFPKISDVGKDDIKHLSSYAIFFLAGYSIYMSTNHVIGFFDWGALASGLAALTGYHTGSGRNSDAASQLATLKSTINDKETH